MSATSDRRACSPASSWWRTGRPRRAVSGARRMGQRGLRCLARTPSNECCYGRSAAVVVVMPPLTIDQSVLDRLGVPTIAFSPSAMRNDAHAGSVRSRHRYRRRQDGRDGRHRACLRRLDWTVAICKPVATRSRAVRQLSRRRHAAAWPTPWVKRIIAASHPGRFRYPRRRRWPHGRPAWNCACRRSRLTFGK